MSGKKREVLMCYDRMKPEYKAIALEIVEAIPLNETLLANR